MGQLPPRSASERGAHRGLAYELWLPESERPWPGMVIIHGAGSKKENHGDFARLASGSGWAALTFDQRGHGESAGQMSPAVVAEAAALAKLLGAVDGVDDSRVCVRGSSLGGFVAIHAAAVEPGIAAVIAICPAGERM